VALLLLPGGLNQCKLVNLAVCVLYKQIVLGDGVLNRRVHFNVRRSPRCLLCLEYLVAGIYGERVHGLNPRVHYSVDAVDSGFGCRRKVCQFSGHPLSWVFRPNDKGEGTQY
jgi:hypothetical protein